MTPEQMAADLRKKATQLKWYASFEFPAMATKKTLRFIQGNFLAQGWQGQTFSPWKRIKRKRGAILIRKSRLRRSFHSQNSDGQSRIWTDSPYASVHNRGFRGTVTIKAHKRRRYSKSKVGTGRYTKTGKERRATVHVQTSNNEVQQHTRQMNITKRQFMPESMSDSPVLLASITKDITAKLKTIFEP